MCLGSEREKRINVVVTSDAMTTMQMIRITNFPNLIAIFVICFRNFSIILLKRLPRFHAFFVVFVVGVFPNTTPRTGSNIMNAALRAEFCHNKMGRKSMAFCRYVQIALYLFNLFNSTVR